MQRTMGEQALIFVELPMALVIAGAVPIQNQVQRLETHTS